MKEQFIFETEPFEIDSEAQGMSRSGRWFRQSRNIVVLLPDSRTLSEDTHVHELPVGGFPLPRDVIDPRIDVGAQKSLLRMFKGDPTARADATGMLAAVKSGELAGIYGDDLLAAVKVAQKLGTVRWKLVPKGEDAALALDPAYLLAAPPTIIFRGDTPDIRFTPSRVDPALHKAWNTFQLWHGRRLRCDLGRHSAEFKVIGVPGSAITNIVPPCTLQNPPQCSCDPPASDLCGSDRESVIGKAFKEASQWLPGAKQKIENYIKNPQAQGNKAAADALKKHFSWTEAVRKELVFPDIPKIVLEVIDDLMQRMSELICPDCPQTPHIDVTRDEARKVFAGSPRAWARTNCYEFYAPFFAQKGKSADVLRAKIVLHEMVHSWRGVGAVETYDSDRSYPPIPELAQNNPDSFAGLIRDLR